MNNNNLSEVNSALMNFLDTFGFESLMNALLNLADTHKAKYEVLTTLIKDPSIADISNLTVKYTLIKNCLAQWVLFGQSLQILDQSLINIIKPENIQFIRDRHTYPDFIEQTTRIKKRIEEDLRKGIANDSDKDLH